MSGSRTRLSAIEAGQVQVYAESAREEEDRANIPEESYNPSAWKVRFTWPEQREKVRNAEEKVLAVCARKEEGSLVAILPDVFPPRENRHPPVVPLLAPTGSPAAGQCADSDPVASLAHLCGETS